LNLFNIQYNLLSIQNVTFLKNKFITIYLHVIHMEIRTLLKIYFQLNNDANLGKDSALIYYTCVCVQTSMQIQKIYFFFYYHIFFYTTNFPSQECDVIRNCIKINMYVVMLPNI